MDSPGYEKSKKLARRIVKLYAYLCEGKMEYVMSKQLLRSGTSIGANLAEARCAISRADFLSKVYISLKETMEALYWLELLCDTGYLTQEEYSSLYADTEELRRILSTTTKTMQND